MIRKISSTAAALLLIASLCAWQQPNKRYEATFLSLFDTVTTVVGYAPSRGDFTAQAQFIHDELEQYHRLYDIYHSYEGLSNLKTINDKAGREPVVVDRKIISMLQMAKKLALETDGRFHPVFGSVTSLWHDYREAGIDDPEQAALPPMPLLQQAALHTALDRLVIDEAASTVYLADPAMRLDVGAIAKGYAVEQVSRAARANGFSSGLISVGGNVCAIGSREDGPWKVGIRSPLPGSDAQTTLRTVGLRDQSLVTSGGYQRYYTVDGRRYHHIIHPDTLMPSDALLCVSIVCGDSGLADALSTAVFNLPLEQGRQLIESLDGVEAFWVLPDGTTAESSGFSALVVLES